MRIIVLNENKYPNYFSEHPILTTDPEFNFNTTIIDRINEYNPKLKIEALVYRNTNAYLDNKMGDYFGLIMELVDVQPEEEVAPNNLFEYEGNTYKCTIFGYIFMSLNEEQWRNTFVSQIIFPELIYLIREIQTSETFEMSGKPMFFINVLNKKITAGVILRDLELIQLAGFNVIHLFDDAEIDTDLSRSIGELNEKYEQNVYCYSETTNEITLKLDELQKYMKTNSKGTHSFNGSSEKFYLISALCIAKFACDIGVKLNVDEIRTFRTTYSNELANTRQSKFSKINTIFDYLEKLSKKKEYFNV